ncbi:MAG: alpha-glucosidase/alpha-galactosidase [Oscillospiraceae bacterium]
MKNKDITIAYIGGGSMNFGWKFIGELSGDEELSGMVRLYDIDKQLSLANEVIGNKMRENPSCKSKLVYLATDTLEEALRGADFVILSISQGTMEEAVSDIHLPEMYGIYQSVGETVGPSGIIRAIRTLPVYIKFAEAIKSCCPNAWVINLTNPMAVCLKTLYEVFPEIKAFGCSSEPFNANELLADFVAKELGLQQVSRRDIKTNIIGINNFSWVTDAAFEGKDITEIFEKYTKLYAENGYEKRPNEYKTNPAVSANMIKFDMFLRYGAISAVSDRHVAEFCPPWYIKNPKVVSSWKFSLTTVNYLKKRQAEKMLRSKRLMNGEETLRIGYSGNDCLSQINALRGLNNIITNADLVNVGQVSNLPLGAVVETNALFSNNSVKPVMAGKLPEEIAALTLRHVFNQETVLKAVFEKDLDIAFNAFLNDPLMTTDLGSATDLYKEMLSASRAHLLYYC